MVLSIVTGIPMLVRRYIYNEAAPWLGGVTSGTGTQP